jgi:hypothetical protein
MQIEITLRAEHDADNDAAELFVRFCGHEFTGTASAWFSLSQLREFANEISQYPLPSRSSLIGGFWDPTGTQVAQEHVCISLEAVGNLGKLRLGLRLAMPEDGGDHSITKYAASANVAIEYAHVSNISKGILALAGGAKQEIGFSFSET